MSTWNVNVSDSVKSDGKDVQEKELLEKEVEQRLVAPIFDEEEKKEKETKEKEKDDRRGRPEPDSSNPLMIGGPRQPRVPDFPDFPDPFGGGRDLDPFGGLGGGGGMLFDPPGLRGGRGRRGQPNFDPFGPHNPDPSGSRGRGGGRRGFGDDFGPPGFNNEFM